MTDNMDRRLLSVYINQFFTDATVTTPKFQLSSLETYYVRIGSAAAPHASGEPGSRAEQVPDDGPLESYRRYIAALPKADLDAPEAFGQHSNADIATQVGCYCVSASIVRASTSLHVDGGD